MACTAGRGSRREEGGGEDAAWWRRRRGQRTLWAEEVGGRLGDEAGGRRESGREEEREKGIRERRKGPKRNSRDLVVRWKGTVAKREKMERVAARSRGDRKSVV